MRPEQGKAVLREGQRQGMAHTSKATTHAQAGKCAATREREEEKGAKGGQLKGSWGNRHQQHMEEADKKRQVQLNDPKQRPNPTTFPLFP